MRAKNGATTKAKMAVLGVAMASVIVGGLSAPVGPAAASQQELSSSPSGPVERTADGLGLASRIAFQNGNAGTTQATYGPNELVFADGALSFIGNCDAGGTRDYFFAAADLYIVPAGPTPAGPLSDVGGAPNTIIASSIGAGFVNEFIAVTRGSGSSGLPPGTYGLVIDECQNGQFDGGEDTFIDAAFVVRKDNNIPPLPPELATIKSNANAQLSKWARASADYRQLAVNFTLATIPTSAVDLLIFMMQEKVKNNLGGGDPVLAANDLINNQLKHYLGLVADPPDYNFDVPIILGPTAPLSVTEVDPLGQSIVRTNDAIARNTVLMEALVTAAERYQGTAGPGDGSWALAQARNTQNLVALLESELLIVESELNTLAADLQADTTDLDQFGDDLALALNPDLVGLSPNSLRVVANLGLSADDIQGGIASIAADDPAGFVEANMIADLQDIANGIATERAGLGSFRTAINANISSLLADPLVTDDLPIADSGGPYGVIAGSSLTVTASGSGGPAALTSYAWDLDGDGVFDDSTQISPSVTPAGNGRWYIGVQVTDANGNTDTDFASIDVTGNSTPVFTTISPDPANAELLVGTNQAFTVSPNDVDGDPTTVTWSLDGVQVGTGLSYNYSPLAADIGGHKVRAIINDGRGGNAQQVFVVVVSAPDADGDGWNANVDCPTDDNAAFNPDTDSDCDGTLNPPPSVVSDAISPIAEGQIVTATGTASAPGLDASIDWGDGIVDSVSPAGTAISASHVYADDGDFLVEICVSQPVVGGSCDTELVTVSNAEPVVLFTDLDQWTAESARSWSQPNPSWDVAADGSSVTQTKNADPSVFVRPGPVGGVTASVTITPIGPGDDDFIGFALGLSPGEFDGGVAPDPNHPPVDFLLVDWKRNSQGICGGIGLSGLAVSRVVGESSACYYWTHSEADGGWPGTVSELQRAATLGSATWVQGTSYQFDFVFGPDRLRVWVDSDPAVDPPELDVAAPANNPFDPGSFAFYNYSQHNVRYSAFFLSAGGVEGDEITQSISFGDPGSDDTHEGTVAWGDGSPADSLVIVEAGGAGTASVAHTYDDDGLFSGEICFQDDDGADTCEALTFSISNAAPVVDAGLDRIVGSSVSLDQVDFVDAGRADTHNATVDWGDGSPIEAATVSESDGNGLLAASHVYGTDGVYSVQVCVTDDDGDTGCDTVELTSVVSNQPPVADAGADRNEAAGTPIGIPGSFTDPNPDDTIAMTVDWDDGSPVETVLTQAGLLGGVGPLAGDGEGTHTFATSGVYDVEFCATDQANAVGCDSLVVTVEPNVLGALSLVQPCVVLSSAAPLNGGEQQSFAVRGASAPACGVPATAGGLLVLVEATSPLHEGNLRLTASGIAPKGGVLNFAANALNNRNVVSLPLPVGVNDLDVSVNAGGFLGATTGIEAKVLGWYGESANSLSYEPLTPCAGGDTRSNQGAGVGFVGPHPAGSTLVFDVVGSFPSAQGGGNTTCNVPASADAVLVNLVAVLPSGSGDLAAGVDAASAVHPYTSFASLTPSMNNSVAVPVEVSGAGTIAISVSGDVGATTQVRIVILGYLEPTTAASSDYVAVTACAAFDTRPSQGSTGGFAGLRTGGQSTTYQITGSIPPAQGGGNANCDVPASATAVAINLVATNAVRPGNLQGYATGSSPTAGVVNFANLTPTMNNSVTTIIPLSASGEIDIAVNGGPAGLGLDVTNIRGVVVGYVIN